MLRIGLTGGIGSGKTTAAKFFANLQVPIIDADEVAHEITKPNQEAFNKIVEHFGKEILTDEGLLNRQKLKTLIFNHLEERRWLENLLHPIIAHKMQETLSHLTGSYCILVIPLLTESSELIHLIDRILVIDVSESLQIQRTQRRDGLTEQQIKLIMQAQCEREKRLAMADDVIVNEGTLQTLNKLVLQLHFKYLKLFKKYQNDRNALKKKRT